MHSENSLKPLIELRTLYGNIKVVEEVNKSIHYRMCSSVVRPSDVREVLSIEPYSITTKCGYEFYSDNNYMYLSKELLSMTFGSNNEAELYPGVMVTFVDDFVCVVNIKRKYDYTLIFEPNYDEIKADGFALIRDFSIKRERDNIRKKDNQNCLIDGIDEFYTRAVTNQYQRLNEEQVPDKLVNSLKKFNNKDWKSVEIYRVPIKDLDCIQLRDNKLDTNPIILSEILNGSMMYRHMPMYRLASKNLKLLVYSENESKPVFYDDYTFVVIIQKQETKLCS